MRSRLTDTDYQLRWPRWVFTQEASALLNRRHDVRDWNDRCALLLEDAFVGDAHGGPCSDFRAVPDGDPWSSNPADTNLTAKHRFLQNLLQHAGQLPEGPRHRKPYWSQRHHGTATQPARRATTVRQFVALVVEFDERGYFEKAFGKDCVDDPVTTDPSDLLEYEIGVADLWPLSPERLTGDRDLFCDVVEVLHDLIARPAARRRHDFAGCGWHHDQFSLESGRAIYRWRVNQLLARSELGLRVAEEGDDTGRLVTAPADARDDLVETMTTAKGGEVGEQVRHANALFRARAADRHQKRSAVVVLCHVLEERRAVIKQHLSKKDEAALFEVANRFNLRHQNNAQQGDYDEAFLDWIFWWYLATIELTDRLAARSSAGEDRADA